MADVLDQLANLNPAELAEVVTRAQFLMPKASGKHERLDGDLGLFGKEYVDALVRCGLSRAVPLPVLLKGQGMDVTIKEACKRVMGVVREHFKAKNRIEEVKCVRLIIGLAVRNLQRRGKPVSPKYLAQKLYRVEELVNRAFPGYAENGLLPILIHRIQVKVV